MTTRTTTTTARKSKAPAKAPSARKATRPAKAAAAPRTAPTQEKKLNGARATETAEQRRDELAAALRSPVPPTGIASVDHLIGLSAQFTALSAVGPGPQSDIFFRAAGTFAALANTALGAVATLRG